MDEGPDFISTRLVRTGTRAVFNKFALDGITPAEGNQKNLKCFKKGKCACIYLFYSLIVSKIKKFMEVMNLFKNKCKKKILPIAVLSSVAFEGLFNTANNDVKADQVEQNNAPIKNVIFLIGAGM